MKLFVKIAAGLGAVVFSAVAVGLPDVCGYCTLRAASTLSTSRMVAGPGHGAAHSTRVSLHDVCDQRWHLPI